MRRATGCRLRWPRLRNCRYLRCPVSANLSRNLARGRLAEVFCSFSQQFELAVRHMGYDNMHMQSNRGSEPVVQEGAASPGSDRIHACESKNRRSASNELRRGCAAAAAPGFRGFRFSAGCEPGTDRSRGGPCRRRQQLSAAVINAHGSGKRFAFPVHAGSETAV